MHVKQAGTRLINGKKLLFICSRAIDPLTGKKGELCSREREDGCCGPRGVFWEQGSGIDDEEQLQTSLYAGESDNAGGPAGQPRQQPGADPDNFTLDDPFDEGDEFFG